MECKCGFTISAWKYSKVLNEWISSLPSPFTWFYYQFSSSCMASLKISDSSAWKMRRCWLFGILPCLLRFAYSRISFSGISKRHHWLPWFGWFSFFSFQRFMTGWKNIPRSSCFTVTVSCLYFPLYCWYGCSSSSKKLQSGSTGSAFSWTRCWLSMSWSISRLLPGTSAQIIKQGFQ